MKGAEDLKRLLRDERLWVCLGQVSKLIPAEDSSYLKVETIIFPELRKIITTMTWENVGENSGDFEFPAVGDMVLVAAADGDEDQSYIIKKLSSRIDKIPAAAMSGQKVHRARAGLKYWNVSDTNIYLSRGDTVPAENLVLGQVFKAYSQTLLEILKAHAQNDADHVHVDSFGYQTTIPTMELDTQEYSLRKEEYDTIKQSPIDDELILSDLGFTEK